jgi:hypothetical protein
MPNRKKNENQAKKSCFELEFVFFVRLPPHGRMFGMRSEGGGFCDRCRKNLPTFTTVTVSQFDRDEFLEVGLLFDQPPPHLDAV